MRAKPPYFVFSVKYFYTHQIKNTLEITPATIAAYSPLKDGDETPAFEEEFSAGKYEKPAPLKLLKNVFYLVK